VKSRVAETITRAFLLAAGLGTRLRPLTYHTPKCLVPIKGKPLLEIWLHFCERWGIQEVLINTHHLAPMVEAWAAAQSSRTRIRLAHEESLLGSAGTVAANRAFIGSAKDFYVFYADNLVSIDLESLRSFHFRHDGVLTLGLFHSSQPHQCGIVTLDSEQRVVTFEEKPVQPESDLANAGVFVARRELLDFLPTGGFSDFGKNILPKLVGRMRGYVLNGYLLDIGTLKNYERALVEWPPAGDRHSSREQMLGRPSRGLKTSEENC
jgi:mannose-1-phosphate guanylyltransferase